MSTDPAESKWPCFWCGSMQAHETGYPGGMSTVPACREHAAKYTKEAAPRARKQAPLRYPTAEEKTNEAVALRERVTVLEGHRKLWRRHAFNLWDVLVAAREQLRANRVGEAMVTLDNASSWLEPPETGGTE